ncbi:MAG TPA: hypothetical protein DDW52_10955 [Planctomycetaceae bacterium]|nr:hypothetical protein [Planctomycetaceae bacterium]
MAKFLPGLSIETSGLSPSSDFTPRLHRSTYDPESGTHLIDISLTANSAGLGRDVVMLLEGLPEEVAVSNASGVTAEQIPFISFREVIPSGGLSKGESSQLIQMAIDNPASLTLGLNPTFLVGSPNRAPLIDLIPDLTVKPGSQLSYQVTATDPDQDTINLSLDQIGETEQPGLAARISADGLLEFFPSPNDIGVHEYLVYVTDGVASEEQIFTLEVLAGNEKTTRVSGQVLSTDLTPLVGVPVEVAGFNGITDSDGFFQVQLPSFVAPTEVFSIEVPVGDPELDPFGTGTQAIPVRRARHDVTTGTDEQNPRQHPNLVTSFIDASMVYGSDDERAIALRTLVGGRLKTSTSDLLPLNDLLTFPEGALENDNAGRFAPNELFVAGDIRVNENVLLLSLHTLLVREHNRLADEIATRDPTLNDEAIYQQARKLVGAMIQHITYQEYLPTMLGEGVIPAYSGYDPELDPSIGALFSVAAFRLGHTQVFDEILRLDQDGAPLSGGHLSLAQAFFTPDPVKADGIEPYLRGLYDAVAQEADLHVIDAVRNFLFGPPGSGGMDLAAINIQRGRDLGLPSYNQARIDFGLEPAATFADITSDETAQAKLRSAYESVEDIDVWVGGIAEDHVSGSMVGPLFQAILVDQFVRLRNADRFWYENSQFRESDLQLIRETTLSKIIERNTSLSGLPASAFVPGNAPVAPGSGGAAANGANDDYRSINGSQNNLQNPSLGQEGTNLLENFTREYSDRISEPAGIDRPNARAISNRVHDQDSDQPNSLGASGFLVYWGQFLDHDISLTPGGADDTLKVFGNEIPNSETQYPFVAEKLPLLFEQPVFPDVNNVVERPIYLPPLNSGTQVNSNSETSIRQEIAPGEMADLRIARRSLRDRDGNLFNGELSITEVPRDLTPAALPDGFMPDAVVTIQPSEMVFTTPAPLTLPNRGGHANGVIMDLWSIDPITGQFEIVGRGQVTNNRVVTIEGGVRTSSWHFFLRAVERLLTEPSNQKLGCTCEANGEKSAESNSEVLLHSGALVETHDTVSYSSLGATRGMQLVYDSGRLAKGRGFSFRFPSPEPGTESPATLVRTNGLPVENKVEGTLEILNGNQVITSKEIDQVVRLTRANRGIIPVGFAASTRSFSHTVRVNSSSWESSGYRARLSVGVNTYVGDEVFGGPAQTSEWDFIHINSRTSSLGAGWGFRGIQSLIETGDRIVLLDGGGTELVFQISASGIQSPATDDSTLRRHSSGGYERIMKDQSRYVFDRDGRLVEMQDRNGNTTAYIYDSAGSLLQVVDPVGLETNLTYTNGYLQQIIDPAGRVTEFEHDTDGNLVSITDPDGSRRQFQYDGVNRMIGETTKRGFQETANYDNYGRVTSVNRKDGTELEFTPVQKQFEIVGQGYIVSPAGWSIAPRDIFEFSSSIAKIRDANGNTTMMQIDRLGQAVEIIDDVGSVSLISRNENNRVEFVQDGRGVATTLHTYDDNGNVVDLSVMETFDGAKTQLAVHPNWAVSQEYLQDPTPSRPRYTTGAHFSEFDGGLYRIARSGVANNGLPIILRLEPDGSETEVGNTLTGADALVVNPADGAFFHVVADTLLRTIPGSGTTDWNFRINGPRNGDHFMGMDIATQDRNAGFLTPGQLLAVSRGVDDVDDDEVWTFDTTQGDLGTKLHADDRTLLDAVDITITPGAIYLVDTGNLNPGGSSGGVFRRGAIYRLFEDGSLEELVTSQPIEEPVAITFDPITSNLLVLDQHKGQVLSVDPESGTTRVLIHGLSTQEEMIATFANNQSSRTCADAIAGNEYRFCQSLTGLDISADGSRLAVSDHVHNVTYVFERQADFFGSVAMSYDPVFNQLTSLTDEVGRRTLFEIDAANGNTTEVRQIVGTDDRSSGETDDVVAMMSYTAQGQIASIVDPLGRQTNFTYDALGRLASVTYAVGSGVEAGQMYEYDSAGNLSATVDENGNRSEFEFDSMNRLTKVIEADPDGPGTLSSPVSTFEYDPAGNLVRSTDAQGSIVETTYDPMDRVLSMTDEQGNVSRYEYDRNGNVLRSIDPLGHATDSLFDARDRTFESIDPDGGKTRFSYDLNNNLTSLTDPVDNVTSYVYDYRDRAIEEIDPLGNSSFYTYNQADDLISKLDRLGRRTNFEYDDLNRMRTETWLDENDVEVNRINYVYDKASNLTAIDDLFSQLAYEYDERDRVVRTSNAGTPGAPEVELAYSYDGVGNVLSVGDTIEGTAGALTTYAYDALNRTVRISQDGNDVSEKRVDFSYNDIGQYTSIDRYSDLAGTQSVAQTTYQYDELNRLIDLRHRNSTEDIAFYEYTYDSDSRISTINDIDGLTTYSYDDRDQLTGADRSNTDIRGNESYTYDANGNRLQSHLHGEGYLPGPANRLLSDGTYNYEYDAEGNMILRTEIATGDYREFEWDHRNRLNRVTDFVAEGAILQRVEFSFDVFGRRLTKTVDLTPKDPTDDTVLHFFYDREQVLIEFADPDGAGVLQLRQTLRNLNGSEVDQVLAQGLAQSEAQWFLVDHLGTTRALYATESISRFTYDSYGDLLSVGEINTRFLGWGREFDSELNLYHFRSRTYDPGIGTFLSEDPIGYRGRDHNLSRFVLNQPHQRVDSTGTSSRSTNIARERAEALSAKIRAEHQHLSNLRDAGKRLDLLQRNLNQLLVKNKYDQISGPSARTSGAFAGAGAACAFGPLSCVVSACAALASAWTDISEAERIRQTDALDLLTNTQFEKFRRAREISDNLRTRIENELASSKARLSELLFEFSTYEDQLSESLPGLPTSF